MLARFSRLWTVIPASIVSLIAMGAFALGLAILSADAKLESAFTVFEEQRALGQWQAHQVVENRNKKARCGRRCTGLIS